MRLDTGQQMRMDQRMKLDPRMIQSMEILQMPTPALEERIEQELASNPTLEIAQAGADADTLQAEREQAQRDDDNHEEKAHLEGRQDVHGDHRSGSGLERAESGEGSGENAGTGRLSHGWSQLLSVPQFADPARPHVGALAA